MPVKVFYDYCLDGCTEQVQYLKEELYKVLAGQPAKYIKVSEHRTVFAAPVIVALSHTDLKTGKKQFITNINKDSYVDKIEVQIIKELLDDSHGFLNLPKAFYAKVRKLYNETKDTKPLWEGKSREEAIETAKLQLRAGNPTLNYSDDEAITLINAVESDRSLVINMEQGGFYQIYLALEYLIAHRGQNTKQKEFSLLELCDKCYPDLVQHKDEKAYFKHRNDAESFLRIMKLFTKELFANEGIGITGIKPLPSGLTDTKFIVTFADEGRTINTIVKRIKKSKKP
jgi:hypothetical protein